MVVLSFLGLWLNACGPRTRQPSDAHLPLYQVSTHLRSHVGPPSVGYGPSIGSLLDTGLTAGETHGGDGLTSETGTPAGETQTRGEVDHLPKKETLEGSHRDTVSTVRSELLLGMDKVLSKLDASEEKTARLERHVDLLVLASLCFFIVW